MQSPRQLSSEGGQGRDTLTQVSKFPKFHPFKFILWYPEAPLRWGWTRWPSKVPSNPKSSRQDRNSLSAERGQRLLHKPNQKHQVPERFWGAKIHFPPSDRIFAPLYAVVPLVYKVASKCSAAQCSGKGCNFILMMVLNCWKDSVANTVFRIQDRDFTASVLFSECKAAL